MENQNLAEDLSEYLIAKVLSTTQTETLSNETRRQVAKTMLLNKNVQQIISEAAEKVTSIQVHPFLGRTIKKFKPVKRRSADNTDLVTAKPKEHSYQSYQSLKNQIKNIEKACDSYFQNQDLAKDTELYAVKSTIVEEPNYERLVGKLQEMSAAAVPFFEDIKDISVSFTQLETWKQGNQAEKLLAKEKLKIQRQLCTSQEKSFRRLAWLKEKSGLKISNLEKQVHDLTEQLASQTNRHYMVVEDLKASAKRNQTQEIQTANYLKSQFGVKSLKEAFEKLKKAEKQRKNTEKQLENEKKENKKLKTQLSNLKSFNESLNKKLSKKDSDLNCLKKCTKSAIEKLQMNPKDKNRLVFLLEDCDYKELYKHLNKAEVKRSDSRNQVTKESSSNHSKRNSQSIVIRSSESSVQKPVKKLNSVANSFITEPKFEDTSEEEVLSKPVYSSVSRSHSRTQRPSPNLIRKSFEYKKAIYIPKVEEEPSSPAKPNYSEKLQVEEFACYHSQLKQKLLSTNASVNISAGTKSVESDNKKFESTSKPPKPAASQKTSHTLPQKEFEEPIKLDESPSTLTTTALNQPTESLEGTEALSGIQLLEGTGTLSEHRQSTKSLEPTQTLKESVQATNSLEPTQALNQPFQAESLEPTQVFDKSLEPTKPPKKPTEPLKDQNKQEPLSSITANKQETSNNQNKQRVGSNPNEESLAFMSQKFPEIENIDPSQLMNLPLIKNGQKLKFKNIISSTLQYLVASNYCSIDQLEFESVLQRAKKTRHKSSQSFELEKSKKPDTRRTDATSPLNQRTKRSEPPSPSRISNSFNYFKRDEVFNGWRTKTLKFFILVENYYLEAKTYEARLEKAMKKLLKAKLRENCQDEICRYLGSLRDTAKELPVVCEMLCERKKYLLLERVLKIPGSMPFKFWKNEKVNPMNKIRWSRLKRGLFKKLGENLGRNLEVKDPKTVLFQLGTYISYVVSSATSKHKKSIHLSPWSSQKSIENTEVVKNRISKYSKKVPEKILPPLTYKSKSKNSSFKLKTSTNNSFLGEPGALPPK